MKSPGIFIILAVAPLLTAALWMDRQQSYKPYQPPVLNTPAGSVPTSGREGRTPEVNPVKATRDSLEQGKILFIINCALCHGEVSSQPGSVGLKLDPRPPGLDQSRMQELSEVFIFRVITLGFGRMPPFKDKLSPRERWDIINFLHTRN
ncbi:MAG: cytochrome c [Deltaproteobacteria bacterium]|nr:cytochrome c [Deltaproteobacteria bacterium]TLN01913.1 MAG: cytochrome c [bacterium]